MTTDMHSITATLLPVEVSLAVKSAQITLDEGHAPYGQVELTCALPDDLSRGLIDLRTNNLRLALHVVQDFGKPITMADLTNGSGGAMAGLTDLLSGMPLSALTRKYSTGGWNKNARNSNARDFNLMVLTRKFDEVRAELTITATTDEALLLGDALVSTTPWTPGVTSVREIARMVLSRYGRELEDGDADATITEPNATTWNPGQGAWEYLNGLLEPSSLRLWCSESGKFRIQERQSITPGAVTITPAGTMTNYADTMTLDPETWYDAVVVKYSYDDNGPQTKYDTAGPTPAKSVLVVDRKTRYPGPGAAAGMLARSRGRGRVLDVQAVNDYRATPGQVASIRPPVGPLQVGYVSAVTWSLPDAEMSVTTRALVDTPKTAYLYGPVGLSYNEVPAGLTYEEFDWSAAQNG